MGTPGAILVSKKIRDELKNQPDISFSTLGSFQFKNVEEPLEVFALSNEGFAVPKVKDLKGKQTRKTSSINIKSKYTAYTFLLVALAIMAWAISHWTNNKDSWNESKDENTSIAVLPFINLNKSQELEYFSDGVTQEIIDELAKIKLIKVSAFTTTFVYKGLSKPLEEIANELNMTYLISGSSRFSEADKKVRLSVELIDPYSKDRLWFENFDEYLDDVPNIQSSVAKEVASELNIELSDSESMKLQKPNTESGEAFRLYLLAKAEINKLNPEGFENGTVYLEKALSIDPNYLQALTLLSWRYAVGGSADLTPGVRSTFESVELATPYLQKAVEIDSMMSDNYLVRANLKLYSQNNIMDAKRDVEKALELNSWPRIPTNYCICTAVSVYIALNDAETAQQVAEQAKEIDPQHALYDWDLGNIDLMQRNFVLAQENYKRSLAKANIPIFNAFLGLSYYANKDYNQALEYYQRSYDLTPLATRLSVAGLSAAYYQLGDYEMAQKYLDELIDRRNSDEYNLNLFIAYVYLEQGDRDKSLEYLELGLEDSDFGFAVYLQLFPGFERLEKEPRFQNILDQIQYPRM